MTWDNLICFALVTNKKTTARNENKRPRYAMRNKKEKKNELNRGDHDKCIYKPLSFQLARLC